MTRDNRGSWQLIYMTVALIILVEITPLVAQSFMPAGPYDSWLGADYKRIPELAESVIVIHNQGRLEEWTYDEIAEPITPARQDVASSVGHADKQNAKADLINQSGRTVRALYKKIRWNIGRRNLITVILIVCFACATMFGCVWYASNVENAVAVGGTLAALAGVLVPVMTRVAGVEPKE